MLDPHTINLETIITRAVLRNIFHGVYAVVNSLKHDLEYELLSPELGLNLLYRPWLTSWLSNKCKYNLICSQSTYCLGEVILLGNLGNH